MEINFTGLDGFKIEYIKFGAGPDLLYLHGGSVSFRTNMPFLEELSKYFTIWAFSFPGAGESARLPKDWEFDDYIKIVEAFIKRFRIHPILCGHSLGGAIALSAFSRKKLCRWVAVFAPAGIPASNGARSVLAVTKNHLKILLGKKSIYKEDLLLNLKLHFSDMLKISSMFQKLDNKNALSKISGKVLIFGGKDDDVLTPSNWKEFGKLIKSSKVYPMDGKHDFLIQNRKKIAQIIKNESIHV